MTGTSTASGRRLARQVPVYPRVRAGHGRPTAAAVESWLQVAWLMLAEGRAYIEDLEGGVDQPQMQQAAKLRLLEQLADVDGRLAGRVPAGDAHQLALALEYGMTDLVAASGEDLSDIFGLAEQFGGVTADTDAVMELWERLLAGFPGVLPDRLIAQGQREMLLTLREWAVLARTAGLDIGLLAPLLKDA